MSSETFSDMEVNPLLSEDAFKSEESRKLFEAIDELRSCGANYDLKIIPELVIVGDQSAGKSSLLQSLTDIPFPVAGKLCTRFPTRIVSRRTPDKPDSTTITIEPSDSDKPITDAALVKPVRDYAAFARTSPNITAADFSTAIEEAADIMGVTRPGSNSAEAGKPNFSSEVLKIEMSGPNRSHFSVLDVPGVFQSLTKDLTKKEKVGVKEMVAHYMRMEASVIVCVASGNNDLANQATFDMASEHDKKGIRTVGVITKCDIAQHTEQVMDLAQNKEKKFQHGWFVVRNRTPTEVEEGIEPLERHMREQRFFDTLPWSELPESRRGTRALKKYLADLLCDRIQEVFPTLLSTIRTNRDKNMSRLDLLEIPRKTIEQKRTYLTRLAQQFHDSALQALQGRYDFIRDGNKRLRMMVREANDAFTLEMKQNGHGAPFLEIPRYDYKHDVSDGSPDRRVLSAESECSFQTGDEPTLGMNWSGGAFGPQQSQNLTPLKVGLSALAPREIPFQALTMKETRPNHPHHVEHFQSISCMKIFQEYSFEELRLSDYLQDQLQHRKRPSFSFGATSDPHALTPTSIGTGNQKGTVGGIFGVSPNSLFSTTVTDTFISSTPTPTNTGTNTTPSKLYTWIKKEVKASKGTELQGTLNPSVLPALFYRQASKWREISETHFKKVTVFTCETLMKLTETVCKDEKTKKEFKLAIQQANNAARQRGLEQLSNRLDDLLSRHLQTNNSAFEDMVREARLLRFQAALERYRLSRTQSSMLTPGNGASPAAKRFDTQIVIDLRDTASLFAELHMSNSQNLEDEIHDNLKAFYGIARDDFIEFVTNLVVEPYLNEDKGPVLFFSPIYVAGLTEERIEKLGGEAEQVVRERAELEAIIARLNHAEKIALKYT